MEALKRRLEAVLARLRRNEAGDDGRAQAIRDHGRRIEDLERRVEQRVKTLDADE